MSATHEDWTLAEVISHLHVGTFTIPSFQRDFVWDVKLIRELLWSILRDYHIGSLLVWEGTNKTVDELRCQEIARTSSGEPDPTKQLIVLDGQQRLTAMYRAFFAPDKPHRRDNGGAPVKVRFYLNVREFMAQADAGMRSRLQRLAPRRPKALLKPTGCTDFRFGC